MNGTMYSGRLSRFSYPAELIPGYQIIRLPVIFQGSNDAYGTSKPFDELIFQIARFDQNQLFIEPAVRNQGCATRIQGAKDQILSISGKGLFSSLCYAFKKAGKTGISQLPRQLKTSRKNYGIISDYGWFDLKFYQLLYINRVCM